jgi:CRP/FNR family transcriptional regulator, cyclic AMP receptor protein
MKLFISSHTYGKRRAWQKMFFKISEKEALLKKVPIFSSLSTRYLRKLGQLMDETRIKPGKILVQQGKTGWDFYLIAEGEARVEKNRKKIRILKPGDFFGEISLIDGGPRMASVISETEMTLLAVSNRSFMKLVDSIPGFSRAMLIALCNYIREAEQPSLVS